MTQNKNKKGIAKKALSISLVAAMLATSNVPVWASGFEAVDPAAEGFAVESAAPETEIAENSTALLSDVTADDLRIDLTANGSTTASVKWDEKVEIKGSINKADGEKLGGWNYVWKKADGTETTFKGAASEANDMSFTPDYTVAGETLQLWIYRADLDGAANFNKDTGIRVNVNKRSLSLIEATGISFEYNGFSQTLPEDKKDDIKVYREGKDGENNTEKVAIDYKSDWYTITATSATNAEETITITAMATEKSPYIGTVSIDVPIGKKEYKPGDIVASVDEGSYQYTGNPIQIPIGNVGLNESQSEDGGVTDKRLNGADLSEAIVKAESTNKEVGTSTVTVTVDNSKLKNIEVKDNPTGTGTIPTADTNRITITKRNLTNNCDVTLEYGAVTPGAHIDWIANDLRFSDNGTPLNLEYNKDYTITITDDEGNSYPDAVGNSGNYKMVITAKDGGNTTGSVSLDFTVTGSIIQKMTADADSVISQGYDYTGNAIEPSKEEIGDLTVNGTVGEETLRTTQYRIDGYVNNINASDTASNTAPNEGMAGVVIYVLSGNYKDQTYVLDFDIAQLKVEGKNITVPKTVSYNKAYTDAKDYQLPATIVATSASGKQTKVTLSESDYSLKYNYKDGKTNHVGTVIETTVTILNDNFKAVDQENVNIKAEKGTEIVAKALTDAMIQVDPSSYTYTGGSITPEFEVIDGSIVLYKDLEYTAVVTDNVNVGTGKITVTGKAVDDEGYSGTATANFEITPAETSSVKVNIDDQDYTGRQVRPRMNEIEVTLNGNDVSSQFEVVSYGENIEAGTGTVVLGTVDGNKNFTGGNITVEFNIVQDQVDGDLSVYDEYGKDITADVKDKDFTFKFDGTAKTFEQALLKNIKTDEGEEVDADNFEIKYADNVTGKYQENGNNIAIVYAVAKDGSGYAGKETITTADGTKIKGVVDYIEFVITSVKFDESNITVTNGTYAGGLPVKPGVLVQIGGNTLVEGKDYEVVLDTIYTEVTAGKTLDVTVNGLGGYSGSTSKTLKDAWGIDKKDLADCDVTLENGVLTVMNGLVLVPSDEYTTTDNGNGSVTVKAATTSRNYTGSVTVYERVPETPNATVLTVTDRTTSTVSLSWDKVEGAEGYTIWFRSEYDDSVQKKIFFDGDITSWTHKGLQAGTKYFYKIRSWVKDAEGNYIFSDIDLADTQRGTTKPIAARIASVSVSNGKIKVNLAGEAAGAEMYSMCYGDSRTCFAANDFKVGIRTQYTTRTLTPTFEPGTYYVCVKSYRDLGNGKRVYGAWSNTFRAVVK